VKAGDWLMRGVPGRGGVHGDSNRHGPLDRDRIRRGEVRRLLLAALLDGPAHGYELMDRLEARAGGRWRPSPGSVYPLLQLFEDAGLICGRDAGGRRTFELTQAGRSQADEGRLRALAADASRPPAQLDVRVELEKLHDAARQVAHAGTPEQLTRAVELIRGVRQAIYRMLAEEADAAPGHQQEQPEDR
jgi:DNA-binding PadR family transcriptional regulator